MNAVSRRNFLMSAGGVAVGLAVASNSLMGKAWPYGTTSGILTDDDISVGIITKVNNPEEDLKIVSELGFRTCQVRVPDNVFSLELAERLKAVLKKYNLKASSLSTSGPGPCSYRFLDGPSQCGLVPRENRSARVARLIEAVDFCKAAAIPSLISHFGFVPGNPQDALYQEFVETMRSLSEYALKQGVAICMESGTETPVTSLRVIEDVGTGNLFVNYDTANYVRYGTSNPLDGLKVVGKYVKQIHAKDGNYPTSAYELGDEVPIPTGEVDFPAVVSYLKQLSFKGSIIIEYELPSESKDAYFLKTKSYLEKFI